LDDTGVSKLSAKVFFKSELRKGSSWTINADKEHYFFKSVKISRELKGFLESSPPDTRSQTHFQLIIWRDQGRIDTRPSRRWSADASVLASLRHTHRCAVIALRTLHLGQMTETVCVCVCVCVSHYQSSVSSSVLVDSLISFSLLKGTWFVFFSPPPSLHLTSSQGQSHTHTHTHTHTIKRDFNDESSLSLSEVFDSTRRCCLTTDYSKWAAERHWHISRNCSFSLTAFSHSTCTTHTQSCLKSTQTRTMGALYNHLKFYSTTFTVKSDQQKSHVNLQHLQQI